MQIEYENHLGERIELNKWPIMLQNPELLFNNKWSYTQGSYGCMYFSKDKQEIQTTLQIFADTESDFNTIMNRLLMITERDTYSDVCGKVWLKKNGEEWYVECNIVANDYTNFEEAFYTIDKKITILASKWIWKKEIMNEFRHTDNSTIQIGHGYPYGYSYGYRIKKNDTLTNNHFAPCNFVMKISGYADNPLITIGNHPYKVNVTVANNEILEIDSKNKTIKLVKADGTTENVFSKRDKTNYIFEKIPTGIMDVSWNGEYSFEVNLFEERSEPKWG